MVRSCLTRQIRQPLHLAEARRQLQVPVQRQQPQRLRLLHLHQAAAQLPHLQDSQAATRKMLPD